MVNNKKKVKKPWPGKVFVRPRDYYNEENTERKEERLTLRIQAIRQKFASQLPRRLD